jgi:hypothetical protein
MYFRPGYTSKSTFREWKHKKQARNRDFFCRKSKRITLWLEKVSSDTRTNEKPERRTAPRTPAKLIYPQRKIRNSGISAAEKQYLRHFRIYPGRKRTK